MSRQHFMEYARLKLGIHPNARYTHRMLHLGQLVDTDVAPLVIKQPHHVTKSDTLFRAVLGDVPSAAAKGVVEFGVHGVIFSCE